MSTKVVHCKREPYDVYIGRPGKWGNPFRLGPDGDREEVMRKYVAWLLEHPEVIEEARKELKGKVLGCWCAPKMCHGHALAEVIDEE